MNQRATGGVDAYETIARSEFSDHVREMARNWKIIALVALVLGGAVAAVGLGRPVLYEANAELLAISGVSSDGENAEFLAAQAAELATTRAASGRAAARSGLDLSVDDVEGQVTLSLLETPGFFVVTVQSEDPQAAVTLASAVAQLIQEEAPGRGAAVSLVDPARSDGRTISGSPWPTAILTAIAAALLSGETLIAIRKLRGRLSPISPEFDIERALGVPCVAVTGTRRASDVDSLVPFFARNLSDRPVLTVLQAGAVGDPRIAAHLGVIAGRFHKRVLMVDADVNGASLHRHFSVERSPGLAEVLEGSAQLRDSLRRVDDSSSTALLAAGSPTPEGLTGPARTQATEQVVINAGADAAVVSVTAGSSLDDALVCVHQFPAAVVLVTDPSGVSLADVRRSSDQIRSVGGRLVGIITAPARGADA